MTARATANRFDGCYRFWAEIWHRVLLRLWGRGLTADTTILDIGDHEVKKEKKVYKNLLYAIRPAFGGSIMATIINWDRPPQMATVREGVMKNEIFDENYQTEIEHIDAR